MGISLASMFTVYGINMQHCDACGRVSVDPCYGFELPIFCAMEFLLNGQTLLSHEKSKPSMCHCARQTCSVGTEIL